MGKFSEGDKVVVFGAEETDWCCNGDVGIVQEDSCVPYVLFGNERVWRDEDKLKHYTPVEDLPLWKSNHMYLNEAQKDALASILHRVQWDGEYAEYAEKIGFNGLNCVEIITTFTREYTEEGQDFWNTVDDQCDNKEIQQDDNGITEDDEEPVAYAVVNKESPIDSHYDFFYEMTRQESDNMQIKIDPYFVSKQWKLGEKDNSGVLFHCLKTIARFGYKNPIEREIIALYKQIRRLAELNNVELPE